MTKQTDDDIEMVESVIKGQLDRAQGISTARVEGASPKSRPGHIRGPGEETSLVGDRTSAPLVLTLPGSCPSTTSLYISSSHEEMTHLERLYVFCP